MLCFLPPQSTPTWSQMGHCHLRQKLCLHWNLILSPPYWLAQLLSLREFSINEFSKPVVPAPFLALCPSINSSCLLFCLILCRSHSSSYHVFKMWIKSSVPPSRVLPWWASLDFLHLNLCNSELLENADTTGYFCMIRSSCFLNKLSQSAKPRSFITFF